jgi:hypothetical protein
MMAEEPTTPDLVEFMGRYGQAFQSGDLDAEMSLYAPEATWEEVELGVGSLGDSWLPCGLAGSL